MIVFIGVRNIIAENYFNGKFLTSFYFIRADNVRHMSVEIITFYLFFLFFYLGCFKNSRHGNQF